MPHCSQHFEFQRNFGYTFGYRHQFGFFALNFAKLLSSMYLGCSGITLTYAYLSYVYGILRKLKIRRRQLPWGFDPPSRHHLSFQ